MNRHFLLLFITLISAGTTHGQFQPLKKFIPAGYTLLDSASGDITDDGIKDLIVVLKNDAENMNGDTSRPLLLLQANKEGAYQLIAQNDHVVLCLWCGGVLGDPLEGITIKNNYFSIEHSGGSSWRWTRIITFKLDKKTRQYLLHRDAGASWHSAKPNKQTQNLFKKEEFGKTTFNSYSNEN